MRVDVYDFDGTIYDGDATIDFYKYCLKKKKSIIIYLLPFSFNCILYFLKIVSKTKAKGSFFKFLIKFKNIDELVEDFWKNNQHKIKEFYLNKKHSKDIIISASPTFLLKYICKKLKVKDLIASEVDKNTGNFLGLNCKGKEKVNRLMKKYSNVKVINMYTDSYSDLPLIEISEKAFLVRKDKITQIK